jgi:hypothetical protein
MTVQSNSGIWLELRKEIQLWMTARGYGDAVYLSEKPNDDMIAQYAVQIVPSGDSALHPRSGVGLLEATINITVWWRGLLDPVNQATERIAGGEGIEQFIDGLRTLLIQNTLGGRLTIPLTWRSGGQIEAVDEAVGWMRGTETFLCAFEMTWEVQ